MIKIKKYEAIDKAVWDEFIENSKNGTFMLKRDFIDYHADRFEDFSLMFYDDDNLLAVMPASKHEEVVTSHGGLTYGGIISSRKMTMQMMLDIFDVLKIFLIDYKIKKLIYKCVPTLYHRYPADEDLYALFRNNAKLFRRDISTAIYIPNKINFSELRRRGIKKAEKNNLSVKQSFDFENYIDLLNGVLLMRHDAKAVHSKEEIKMLSEYFPENIKLFVAGNEEKIMAGVLIFDANQTVHAQYIANSDEGRNIGALDLIIDYLVNEYSKDKKYFDFGISTEQMGMYLNNGLINQKEMFGGRGIVYDFYEWVISNG